MYLAFVFIGAMVLIPEFVLWMMYRKKAEGLMFPEESDESYFHFFSRERMKYVVILQSIFLIVLFVICTLILW